MPVTMLPWKDIFDSIVAIVKFIKEGYSNTTETRKNYFNNHIEPAYVKIELVHKDYLTTLSMLVKMKKKEQKSNEEVIEWLKERKIEFQTERIRLQKLQSELFNNDYFNKTFKKDTEISKWTVQYLEDIFKYFKQSNYLQDMTWYSYLIQVIESSVALQNSHPESGPAGLHANASSADIFKHIDTTIGVITSQFDFISESYSRLRGLCL
ncbi:hypothetical protein [Mucilaginibacter sp. SP1R1]|uniref:hypothetical protein n=1 Tax=Mucilaginibacter sp. SP1R1 TaxID=2723091 RepID=UPI00161F9F5E|nr:hypothetical protein [Mucilaginibacter sp. SP1R1]MBB6149340.1 hypothetical protein [Mucilaginibacter sp. SP1R1]